MGFGKKYPFIMYLFKYNNRNSRKRCEICLKLAMKNKYNVTDIFLACLLLA